MMNKDKMKTGYMGGGYAKKDKGMGYMKGGMVKKGYNKGGYTKCGASNPPAQKRSK